MAIDTDARRASTLGHSQEDLLPVSSGTVGDSERAVLLGLYHGFDYAGDDGGSTVPTAGEAGQWRAGMGFTILTGW